MANMQDDEREQFEAWAQARDDAHGGTIVSVERGLDYPLGRLLWEAWQAARASLPPAPEPVAGWQPIETALRDGTNILLRFGQDGVSQGKFIPGLPHPWQFIDTDNGISWLINHAADRLGGPSHWMPLPQPPRSKS